MNKIWLGLVVVLVALAGITGYVLRGDNTNNSSLGQDTNQTAQVAVDTSQTADYSGKGLTKFPSEVLNKTGTTKLILSNNQLSGALPGEIRHLTNLEELDVDNNRMTGIPAEIGQLKKLKILNYNNNRITGLPMELGNLTQLEVLDLSGNNVSQQDLAKIRAKLTNTQIKL